MGDCCSSEVTSIKNANTVDSVPMLHEKNEDQDAERADSHHAHHDSDDDIYSDEEEEHEKAKKLLIRGMTVDEFGNSVEEQWQHAVQESDNKKLRELFQKYNTKVDFLTIVFENGDNSLHYAARTGNVKLAKLLILIGIDINQVNQISGNTALHYAVLKNNVKMVKLLVEKDCDPDIKNRYNKFAKDIAQEQSNEEILELLSHATHHSLGMKHNSDGNHDLVYHTTNTHDLTPHGISAATERSKAGSIAFDNSDETPNENNNGDNGDNDQSNNNDKTNDTSNGSRGSIDENKSDNMSLNSGEIVNDENIPIITEDNIDMSNIQSPTGPGIPLSKTSDLRPAKTPPRTTIMKLHSLTDDTHALPELSGYLDKKKNKAPFNYQRRWVIVAKPYLLWSEKMIFIKDGNDQEQRKKFNGFFNLTTIQTVIKHQSKGKEQTKFIVTARDPKHNVTREYLFKCDDEKQRNEWVDGINQYIRFFADMHELLK